MLATSDITDHPTEGGPDTPPGVRADAVRAIGELSDRIQRLIDPLDAPLFLKQIFCQTLDWHYVNQPLPTTLLPTTARDGIAEVQIIAQCEDIRLCYVRADRSEIMAADQHKVLARLSNAWPQVVVGFANFGQNQLDVAIRAADGTIHRISLDRSLFGPDELAQALYALRAFDVARDDTPVQMEVVERLERQFKRLPRRLRVRRGLHSDPFYRELARHRLLTREDEATLRRQFMSGQKHSARDKLVLANLRLVTWVAYRYRHQGIAWEDLLQVGVLGLLHAADRFDPALGTKFSTYATLIVWQRIQRAVESEATVVAMPAGYTRLLGSFRRFVRDHVLYFGIRPSPDEIADFFELDAEHWLKLRQVLAAALPYRWLTTVSDGEAGWVRLTSGHDRERTCNEDAQVTDSDQIAAVAKVLRQHLDSRSADVIRRRFGIGGGLPETLEQIGMDIGVTRERIRQIESKALRRIARPLREMLGDSSWPLPEVTRSDKRADAEIETPPTEGAMPDAES